MTASATVWAALMAARYSVIQSACVAGVVIYGSPRDSSLRIVRAARVCGEPMSSQWMSSGSLVWSVSESQIVGRKSGSAGRAVWQR
jgi:hypothetical protein